MEHKWREVPLPLGPERWAILAAWFPLSEDEWQQMLKVLEAMKPALVAQEAKGE